MIMIIIFLFSLDTYSCAPFDRRMSNYVKGQRFTPKLFPSLVSSVFPSLLHLSYKYHYDLSNGPQILYMVRTKRVQILKYKYDLSNGPRIWVTNCGYSIWFHA
jgi:hypothetical protein